MPEASKRKRGIENNTGLYQGQPALSTTTVALTELGLWLAGVLVDQPPHVWLLSGPVGAGKTTLVQHLAKILGVTSHVTSPTFALQKVHPLTGQPWRKLVHVDAYRLLDRAEAAALELDEHCADPLTLLVVEWPENLPGVRWGAHMTITLAPTGLADSREITIRRSG